MSQQSVSSPSDNAARYLGFAASARREAERSDGDTRLAYLTIAKQWEWLAQNMAKAGKKV